MDADSIWLNRPFGHIIEFSRDTGMFAVYHFENPAKNGSDLLLNGIFGVCKCHPAMEHIIRSLQLIHPHLFHVQDIEPWQRTGPGFFTAALRGFPVATVESDVFAPGSWFFDVEKGDIVQTVSKRMKTMKDKFPKALTFQVGASTHGYDSTTRMNCKAWASQIRAEISHTIELNNSEDQDASQLVCGNFTYSDLAKNIYPP
jgi:hypothetical protein